MATGGIKGTPAGQVTNGFTNLRGAYLAGDDSAMAPTQDSGILITTAAVTAAQSAAFLLLNLPDVQLPDTRQFVRKLKDPNSYTPDRPDGYSKLNTPIYGRVILGLDGQENKWTDAQGKTGSYQTVELDCAICIIDFNNQVVMTKIQGLPQTIKEYISGGDDDVTITGIFNSTPGVAPLDFIINMNRLFKAPVPIPVTNYYLNANNIYYLCIMPGTTMGQVEGGYATQTFTIKAVTDTPMTEMLP